MRTSTFLRAGAVLTASALAFSLGAGPVSAAESTAGAAAVATAEPVETAATITGIRISSGVITNASATFFRGTVTVAPLAPGQSVTAETEVRVNGKYRGRAPIGPNGVSIPRTYGSGKVRVGPTYFSDGTVDGNVSNVFYARKEVRSKATFPLKIRRVNSKITFRAYGVKIVNPTTGKYQSVKRVKLQQLKNGKWKTKKTIKLKSSGNGTYKTSIKKKYRYRLYVPRTSTQQGFQTVKTGKI
ncbi:MAG: hypothetical protein JWR55_2491 [Aeromicrobium sp.]|nr:hypothetical protein [Aeromicrobium sp.]